MPKFIYTITDIEGRKKEGAISAPSKEAATQKLKDENKIVLSIMEDSKAKQWPLGRPSMSMDEKMMFVKNLATMIKAGITISESFSILRDQAKKSGTKKMFEDILDMINSGQSLGKSLRKYDNNFSDIFINMVATGEEAGNLEKVLNYLDIQLEKEYDIRKKVISALIYPAIIITITLLMAVGIMVFIMPKITKIFKTFKADLPLPTKTIIAMSNFLIEKPILSFAIFVGIIVFFVIIFKIKTFKPFLHRITISLPIFGTILVTSNIARFSRTMNSLLQASVSIPEALRITGNMLGNYQYKNALFEVSEKVERGGKIGENLEKYTKLFPIMCTKLIYLGEKTGTLESIMEKSADLYEKETDTKTKNLSVIVEPLLLVLMAAIVGGMAISIIMPIYQLPNLINK